MTERKKERKKKKKKKKKKEPVKNRRQRPDGRCLKTLRRKVSKMKHEVNKLILQTGRNLFVLMNVDHI